MYLHIEGKQIMQVSIMISEFIYLVLRLILSNKIYEANINLLE